MMKKLALATVLALVLPICVLFSGCSDYSPIEPTEQESREVAHVGDYPVLYDELRFSALHAKSAMTEAYGVDWSDPEQAEQYREELYSTVWDNLSYNFAVISLFDSAFAAFYEGIDESVQTEIEKITDLCGGRQKYIEYLRENNLTDRLLRFNIKVEMCEYELLSYYSELVGKIDTSYDAILEYLFNDGYTSELIRVMHICIEGDSEASQELALDLRARLVGGEDVFTLAEQYSADYADLKTDGDYISRGDYFEEYEEVAFSLLPGAVSAPVLIDSDYYIICRLEKEQSYIMENYESLYDKYLYMELDKIVDAHLAQLTLVKTELGESIDLVAIK